MVLLGKTKAEPAAAAPEAGVVVAPQRHTADPRVVVQATATKHAARAGRRPLRIRLACTTIVAIPVLAPLPNVAAHVIQAKLVGTLGLHRMGIASAVVGKKFASRDFTEGKLPSTRIRELRSNTGGIG